MQFVSLLLLAVPPALLFAGFAGYRMAFKVLHPLKNMALHAETITASHLDQRLPVENPNDELGHMARVLNELLGRLQDSFDNLKRFTADASHELRTPLASIRSVGEVGLQRLHTPEEYRDTIGSMLEEVTRLTEMVDGLLSISRADAGQIALHRTNFKPLDLAREVVALLGLLAEEKGQHILLAGEPDLLVHADRMLLQRGLANIFENAIKHSPVGTRSPSMSALPRPAVIPMPRSLWRIVARRFRRSYGKRSLSDFSGWTRHARGRLGVVAWVWPSPSGRLRRMAEASVWVPGRREAIALSSGFRGLKKSECRARSGRTKDLFSLSLDDRGSTVGEVGLSGVEDRLVDELESDDQQPEGERKSQLTVGMRERARCRQRTKHAADAQPPKHA